jgi:hypothetical protein
MSTWNERCTLGYAATLKQAEHTAQAEKPRNGQRGDFSRLPCVRLKKLQRTDDSSRGRGGAGRGLGTPHSLSVSVARV